MIAGYIIFLGGIALLVGAAEVRATLDSLWVCLTLAGAMVASSSAFLLNPLKEATGVKVGRALVAGVFGVVVPRFVFHWFPDWQWLTSLREFIMQDQTLIFGTGFAFGMLGFGVAVALIKTSMDRGPKALESLTRHWEAQALHGGEDYSNPMLRHSASDENPPIHPKRP